MPRDPRKTIGDINALGVLGRGNPERIKDLILWADELLKFLPALALEVRRERGG